MMAVQKYPMKMPVFLMFGLRWSFYCFRWLVFGFCGDGSLANLRLHLNEKHLEFLPHTLACLYAVPKSTHAFCCGNQPNIFAGLLNSCDWLGYVCDTTGNSTPKVPFFLLCLMQRFFDAKKEVIHASQQTSKTKCCQMPKRLTRRARFQML
jgi:hypothetical protein